MKKISILFVMLLLVLSAIAIVPQDRIVEADTCPPIYPIDNQYIEEITEDLSDIIITSYGEGELAKGRYFGSKGEQDAAEYLADEMADLGLYDPTKDYYADEPYLEKIENISVPKMRVRYWLLKNFVLPEGGDLTKFLEVTDRGLIVNNSTNASSVDCYISPRWNETKEKKSEDIEKLTYNFNHTGLKVIRAENYTCNDSFLSNVRVGTLSGKILKGWNVTAENISLCNNYPLSTLIPLKVSMRKAFEDYYGFNFSTGILGKKGIDSDDPDTWPSFLSPIEDVDNGFVFIEEYPNFHPNILELPSLEDGGPGSEDYNEMYLWSLTARREYYNLRMRAWYRAYPECKGLIWYDYLDNAYDTGNTGVHLPVIYINGSKGDEINDSVEDYTIDFWVNQRWNTSVESYNVIGQINGTNPDKTVIIGCLYDSMWCQGTVDSAIGVGIMLTLAKYFKQNNITPKYNLRFIAYAGEEVGCRGAHHYESAHKNETIAAVIDLNQFGYKQSDVTSIFNLITNRVGFLRKLDYMSAITDYIDRTPANVSQLRTTHISIGSLSDDMVFALAKWLRPNFDLKTVLLLRDLGWYRHHRDGMNHSDGDSMKYYFPEEVNLTAEMIWNVTKYFSVNPNCWFKNINHELWDSPDDNNNIPDHLNLSFTIKTCMPDDHVKVKAVLYHNAGSYLTQDCYTITSNSDINDNISFSLPENAPVGWYGLYVYLFNSTGEVNNYALNLFGGHHPIRDLATANDTYIKLDFYMGGLNDESNQAAQPSSTTQNMLAGTSYTFTTSATDPNSEQVYYQFNWASNSQENKYSSWIGPYNSGVNCTVPHTWTTTGGMQVQVRSRDKWFSPNGWSNWSNPLKVKVEPGCAIEVDTYNVLVNSQMNFSGVNYDFGSEGSPANWNWSYGNENTSTDQETTSQNYSTTGSYTVNLILDNATSNVSYEIVINVVNLSSVFSVNKNSVQPKETVYFTDLSEGLNTITNWTWDFGDGNISYLQHPNNSYVDDGLYNVTLNVTDGGNISSYYQTVCVDSVPSTPVTAFYSTDTIPGGTTPSSYYIEPVGYGMNITTIADFFDNLSGVDTAKFNVTYPDGSGGNFTMVQNDSRPHDYEYVFDDTWQIGDHIYTTWVVDKANNSNFSSNYLFIVEHLFGYTHQGSLNQSVDDRITGSVFKVYANGTADKITAYIQTNLSTPPKTKCMIYRANDSALIGTTEELTPTTGDAPSWVVFNFTGSKPTLVENTEYVLTCWSNDTCCLYYDNASDWSGRYRNMPYGSPPGPASWTDYETRLYSIYCSYTSTPEILNVSNSPDVTLGLGSIVNISAVVNGFGCSFDSVIVNITYPDNFSWNFTMDDTGNDTFEHMFLENWLVGQYNCTIWAYDEFGSCCNSSGYSFNVSADAAISVCTVKDEYGNNEMINLTDPPGDPPLIGYGLLDDGDVLRIWNNHDSYYFDTNSGIQLTNHYDDYWSHNVLMLGYYNNDQWNLIYRTDELSGFNKDIDTDNETYVNATLWKDLTYNGYDFRLAIRYHLGVGDNELTVIPYIKNLGDAIPYVLGFAWEINDIQVDMTPEDDYIEINGTSFYLNETVDVTFMNMTTPVYCWNETTNESYVCGYEAIPYFYIREDKPGNQSESLYLKWDESLDYMVQVKSRDGEYNAPVTLAFKIGTLGVDQEKFTSLLWHDASEVVYYFNSYDTGEAWPGNPGNMVDGNISTYASVNNAMGPSYVELCDRNTCPRFCDLGTISKIELRVRGYHSGSQRDIILRPVYGGTEDGDNHTFQANIFPQWSSWFDITPIAMPQGAWDDIRDLDCDVEAEDDFGFWTLYCSKVELRVTYTPHPPEISNPYPADGSTGVGISPLLNITVSDPQGDDMNISWLSNSSGSGWQVFGTNNSVGNGTYHQTFSNASVNGQWWYWKVNVSDENGFNESSVYRFYTGYQSKIENTGSTNLSGYLCMQIHYYNETSQNWTVVDEPVNEGIPRMINAGQQFGLDTVFNGIINTSDLSEFGNGTYRVYAVLKDLYGYIMAMDDETELVATYEFTVTFE